MSSPLARRRRTPIATTRSTSMSAAWIPRRAITTPLWQATRLPRRAAHARCRPATWSACALRCARARSSTPGSSTPPGGKEAVTRGEVAAAGRQPVRCGSRRSAESVVGVGKVRIVRDWASRGAWRSATFGSSGVPPPDELGTSRSCGRVRWAAGLGEATPRLGNGEGDGAIAGVRGAGPPNQRLVTRQHVRAGFETMHGEQASSARGADRRVGAGDRRPTSPLVTASLPPGRHEPNVPADSHIGLSEGDRG